MSYTNGPGDMPEELKRILGIKPVDPDAVEAEHQANRIRETLVIESFTKDQLLWLNGVMRLASNDESGRFASFFEGRFTQRLRDHFNVCPCGENHNDFGDLEEVGDGTPLSED